MIELLDEKLKLYALIDWSKPEPPIRTMIRRDKLTPSEAQIKNNALRMNRTTLRWVPDEYTTQ